MMGNSKIPYYILAYIWSLLFIPNMIDKDNRIKNVKLIILASIG